MSNNNKDEDDEKKKFIIIIYYYWPIVAPEGICGPTSCCGGILPTCVRSRPLRFDETWPAKIYFQHPSRHR